MISEALYSSANPVWATPPKLFAALDREFRFELDAAASAENTKCPRFYSRYDDGLSQPWAPSRTWCNPPYGRAVGAWVAKAHVESDLGALVVMLLPARTDTRWFHEHVIRRAEVRFLPGRVRFVGAKAGAPFPSIVVVFRPRPLRHERVAIGQLALAMGTGRG